MKQITSIGEILFDLYDGQKKLGGAPFNFFYHIINLTGGGNFISRIGDDRLGKEILEFFKSHKIDSNYIQIDKKNPTGEANAKLDVNKIPTWNIKPEVAYDYIEDTQEIIDLLNEKTMCIYFGTLAQRSSKSRTTIQSLFKLDFKYFYDLNIRQNFYSKKIIESSLNAANVVKLNLDELKLVGDLLLNIKNPFIIEDAASLLIKNFDIDLLCITMGENGAILFKNGTSYHFQEKLEPEEIVDTIGAGDAYSAILCTGYLKGWDIIKINSLACRFASEIIKIKGALPPDNLIYFKYREKLNSV